MNVVILTEPLQVDPHDDATVSVKANHGHLKVVGYPPQGAAATEPARVPAPIPAPPPGLALRPPEAITTDPAGGGSCREKTLTGLVDPRGWETLFRFIWRRTDGDTTHYGPWRSAGAGTSRIGVREPIDALVPDRNYEAKVVAESAGGRGEGDWRPFTTASC